VGGAARLRQLAPAAGRKSVYHYDYRRARDLGYVLREAIALAKQSR
jgi:hypothetical protein